jgi:hypothetical protein
MKTTFTDSEGRTWRIEITDKALQHIADAGLFFEVGPEMRISDPLDETLDPNAMLKHQQIIFALIEPEAIRQGVSWGDFRAAMSTRELLGAAWEAVNNAVVARFPKGGGRPDGDVTDKLSK